MRSADSNAKAGFTLGDGRIADGRNEDPLREQFLKSLHRFLLIPDDHGKNCGLGLGKPESKSCKPPVNFTNIGPKFF